MENLAFYSLLASAAAWGYLGLFHYRFWQSDQILPEVEGQVKKWPSITIVIPARNEAAVLAQTLPSVTGQKYKGDFQVILVNDSSTDDTSRVAGEIEDVHVLNAKPLQKGWTGKLWAIKQGVDLGLKKFPKTEYFWFTDADIAHQPDVLEGLVETATLDSRAMVSQMVMLHCRSFWEKAFVPAFIFFFEMLYPFPAANSDKSKLSGAAGGCILLEKRWLLKIGGIERIKSALIDDCALADAVKGDGGRIWLGFGVKSRSIRSYTFHDFWTTVTRTAFTQLKNSSFLLLGTVLAMTLVFLAPPGLAFYGLLIGDNILGFGALLIWLLMAGLYLPTLKLYKLNPVAGLFLPLIATLYMFMTIHSAIRVWRGKGGQWKKRSYDFKE